jgi:hypothetical protein
MHHQIYVGASRRIHGMRCPQQYFSYIVTVSFIGGVHGEKLRPVACH